MDPSSADLAARGRRAAAWLPLELAYGVYAWAAFAILAPVALLGAMVLPQLALRRRATRWVARTWLRIVGLRLSVHGLEQLPRGQAVVVANHASYLDGLVMIAALPPRFAYVIKREMASVPVAALLLRRIGSEFVDRFNRHRGASDARRMLRNASSGQSLMFFPEGTFSRQPGLLKFHTGAFATAARAGCVVVPAIIRGSRAALPASRILPRWGRIEVRLLEPLRATGSALDHATAELRDRARAQMLAELGEPDLSQDPAR